MSSSLELLDTLQVDSFFTKWNARLPLYCSLVVDEDAWGRGGGHSAAEMEQSFCLCLPSVSGGEEGIKQAEKVHESGSLTFTG